MSTICLSDDSSSLLTVRTTMENSRSSENTLVAGSEITSAMESVRWVTRLRAAELGTYPSSLTARSTVSLISGVTVDWPLTTRETVARETPARAATASRVGRFIRRALSSSGRSWGEAVPPDDIPVAQPAVLGEPAPGLAVGVHDPEPPAVPIVPLEVTRSRPYETPPEVHVIQGRGEAAGERRLLDARASGPHCSSDDLPAGGRARPGAGGSGRPGAIPRISHDLKESALGSGRGRCRSVPGGVPMIKVLSHYLGQSQWEGAYVVNTRFRPWW